MNLEVLTEEIAAFLSERFKNIDDISVLVLPDKTRIVLLGRGADHILVQVNEAEIVVS